MEFFLFGGFKEVEVWRFVGEVEFGDIEGVVVVVFFYLKDRGYENVIGLLF